MYRAFVESGFSAETKMKSFFRRLEDYLQAGREKSLLKYSSIQNRCFPKAKHEEFFDDLD